MEWLNDSIRSSSFVDCDDALFFKMKQHCGKFIRVCKEINLAFLPHESQVASTFLNIHLSLCFGNSASLSHK